MKEYMFVASPKSVDGHVHFSVMMHDLTQHVFASTILVESDAHKLLSRAEAEAYVTLHVRRFVDAARKIRDRTAGVGAITLEPSCQLDAAHS